MKSFRRLAFSVFACLSLLALPARAQSASPPPLIPVPGFFTNAVPPLANLTNVVKRPIEVPPRTVVVFQATIVGANIGTSNIVFGFNGSLDGQRWTTTYPYTVTVATTSSNAINPILILGTNLPVRFLSLDNITTPSTNAISISNLALTFFPSS